MKKATLLAFAFAAFAISSETQAQTTNTNAASQQVAGQDTGKEQITPEQLPEGVKEALKNEALKDWQVSEVYKLAPQAATGTEAKATYEVYFTNAEQKQAVARFDETGKALASAEGQQE